MDMTRLVVFRPYYAQSPVMALYLVQFEVGETQCVSPTYDRQLPTPPILIAPGIGIIYQPSQFPFLALHKRMIWAFLHDSSLLHDHNIVSNVHHLP